MEGEVHTQDQGHLDIIQAIHSCKIYELQIIAVHILTFTVNYTRSVNNEISR